MKPFVVALLTLMLFAFAGCGGGTFRQKVSESAPSGSSSQSASAPSTTAGTAADQRGGGGQATMQNVSLKQAGESQEAPVAVERKIIRNASVSLEVEEPQKAMQRVASIAESRGGFVVTSESQQQAGVDGGKAREVIAMEVRVPAQQFDAAMNDIRGVASNVTSQKITGQDVTEEYIDLEARLRTQRALESQLLDIMKSAHQVSDAINVERELANVRTEIEKIEGRKRFLENQSSLSTISVTLQPPAPLVSTTGFFRSVASAFGDGIDIAAAITLFLIRFLLALVPIALFIGLPIYFLIRWLVRRARRRAVFLREAQAQQQPPPPPVSVAPEA